MSYASFDQANDCPRCYGDGKIATDDDGSPWGAWEELPPGSDFAVRLGIVRPIDCPDCGGTGSRAAAEHDCGDPNCSGLALPKKPEPEIPNDLDPDHFEDQDAYAIAVQMQAIADVDRPDFDCAIGGTAPDETRVEIEYATEPMRGSSAAYITDDLYNAVESLTDFCQGARIVKRQVTYGAWEYVTPEEIKS
ncbi:hypothetical protein [Mycolicibacterium komossense]|uniref:Uncharacterized protein n=1 Tax=Mycolicibacterium komossense TaxID=1779 RepID=A0ABT3CMI1_9MYCO|nr:hypothetical protein [Mycolicibacterium komossense]MCV7230706.1 hypothetical protein [Mycolicibacterium komossense]